MRGDLQIDMTGRIITARHGRPDLSREVKITAREYGDWWKQYDKSGLHPDERPPQSLIDLAAGAETIISSTLPRAVETARHVTADDREIPADVLFVEAPLPPPPLPFLRLKPGAWGVISRSFWFWGYAPGGMESHRQTWKRVAAIGEQLKEHASKGDVLLCAHGYLNWMIHRHLTRTGWELASREGGNQYWSWRIYEPAGAPTRDPISVDTQSAD